MLEDSCSSSVGIFLAPLALGFEGLNERGLRFTTLPDCDLPRPSFGQAREAYSPEVVQCVHLS